MRNRLPILIGAILGILTIILVRAYMQQREQELRRQLLKGQEPIPVLVALKNVPANARIEDGMVEVQQRPAYSIQPHALTDSGDAVGKITVIPLYEGEQVTDAKLSRPENVEALSMKTPPGKRAVTMNVDTVSGVAGLIKPGDYVDVLGVFAGPNPMNPSGERSVVTVTLLQRVEVLAVGRHLTAASVEGQDAGVADNVTMALTPQDAQLITFAKAAQGQLQLSLRPRADTVSLADLPPTTQETLLGVILGPKALEQLKQQVPEVAKKAPERTVEVFRGLKREVVALPEKE